MIKDTWKDSKVTALFIEKPDITAFWSNIPLSSPTELVYCLIFGAQFIFSFSYAGVNRLSECFKVLSQRLISAFIPNDCDVGISLVDSMPVITCAGRNREAKVAREIVGKGFCSTKNQYYYGLKLHALTFRRKGTIPFPEFITYTPAEDNDLDVFKQNWGDIIAEKVIFGDKIYSDFDYFNEGKKQTWNIQMLTPVKAIKGQSEQEKQRNKAYNDLFSTAVSKVRQPIESFFNWLNERTTIQRAQKVRSTSGLLIHTMGKIAIAFIYLIL